MKSRYTSWLIALLITVGALWPAISYATHVRAGEIITRRVGTNPLTYEITLITYYDEQKGAEASRQTTEVLFCFGDGNSAMVPRDVTRSKKINPNSSINVYHTIYTYPGPGTYQISAYIENRNAGTINIGNPDGTTFWIRTMLTVNAGLGLNSSPVLLNPPLDSARVGQKFCHNPAAFDSDGDSLAYRMAVPQQGPKNNPCRGIDVGQYRDPARGIDPNAQNEAKNGSATLTINSLSGDLCWDAPAVAGQYNIAFVIEEWRDGVLIGEIVRDIQVIVTDSPNKRPLLIVPPDLCVEAGKPVNSVIRAYDPDGHRVEISAYSGIFNIGPDGLPYNPPIIAQPYARFLTPTQPQSGTATGTVSWTPSCGQIRDDPYEVVLRVVDFPPKPAVQLATLETFQIRVIGPRPQGLTARPTTSGVGRAMLLTWTPYTCTPSGTSLSATQILVYRKQGCASTSQTCTTGIPQGEGYTEIGRVTANLSSFTDTTNLPRGIKYSYRIVALYPLPTGGSSVASTEVCIDLPLLAPILTNVTVDSTYDTKGVITVKWTRPIGLNPADGGAPFQYRLFRATGLSGTNFTQVTTITTNLAPAAADTVFIDRNLNTVANAYRYRLEFYFTDATTGQLTRSDVSEAASSVRLNVAPANRQMVLTWQASTPWTNDKQTHRIYRSRTGPNGPFNRIADVPVQAADTYTYTDRGQDTYLADGNTSLSALSPDSSYCYRVETVGTYPSTSSVKIGLLYNFSQGSCASPGDTTRPCPPNLTLDLLDCASLDPQAFCNQATYTNKLTWTNPAKNSQGKDCDTRILSYNIYFSRYNNDQPLQKIDNVPAPTMSYQHVNLTTVAGCYFVTAVNRTGVESAPSNKVCKDICPAFLLPNVFTPNNDGKNDVLRPMSCPAFVESVSFVAYNRWGAEVYQTTDPNINWNGSTANGQPLPSGLYYYQVVVRFAGLDPNAPAVTLKGWVEIIREAGNSGGD